MKTLNETVLVEFLDEEVKSEGGLFIANNVPSNLVHVKILSVPKSKEGEVEEGSTAWVSRNLVQRSENFKDGKQGFVEFKYIYAVD
jgi:co-chaperonin GroES (HSP10)